MKKTIVFIAPHLSTGGMPQYLVKKIELIKDDAEVYCIEWDNVTGGVLVVQRNKVVNLLGDRLITLGEDKHKLFDVIDQIQPDIIHLEEIPELFMQGDIAHKLYYQNERSYSLIETSHDSSFNVNNKRYIPDKFLMVSNFQVEMYKHLGVPTELVEYPIENKVRTKTREQALHDLGLDPNLKHVINVGLFTPRKNQAEIIEYARQLQNYPIQFHFIGNQADNFKGYWEPLMQNFPSNCKWWNERSDVDSFYEAADLFLFTSRGNDTDKETMPLVIRESLGWKIPSLIYNLPVYMGYFDKYDTIEYLTEDLQQNAYRIAEKLCNHQIKYNDCIVIAAYPNTAAATKITKDCILRVKHLNIPIILSSHFPIPTELQELVDYCIFDSNNILTTHTFYQRAWYTAPNYFAELNIAAENNNTYHGPAVYTAYYNAIALAHSLGFENAHCWNYDVLLNDDTQINMFRRGLSEKKAVARQVKNQEGNTILTVRVGLNTQFFLEHFPLINNEQEYTEWMNKVGSESNGIENMWYHALKNVSHDIRFLSDEEYDKINKTSEELCSMIEYFTVLPIENNETEGMIWYSSSNEKDSRILSVYVNGDLVDTIQIDGISRYHRPFNLHTTKEIRFEMKNRDSVDILSTKTILIDEEYIKHKLKNNGIFRYENS